MKLHTIFSLLLLLIGAKASANPLQLGQMPSSLPKSVEINNRVLARVAGELITVFDVTKYMDMAMWKQYPEAFDSPQLRYQFYMANWKNYLKDLIERALILEEAKKLKMEVSNGDLRQELENLYGPNLVVNLNKMGQSLKDVEESTRKQLMMQKLLAYKVHQPALKHATPKKVKDLYEEYAKSHQREGFFEYRVISLRSKDLSKLPFVAEVAAHLLSEENVSADHLKDALETQGLLSKELKLSISDLFQHKVSQLSDLYKETLLEMAAGTYSLPKKQITKDKEPVYRIFYLKNKQVPGAIPFEEAEAEIKRQMLNEKFDELSKKYLQDVAKMHHFDLEEALKQISEDFTPYILK